MKSGKDPASAYLFAAGVAGQVGCLITVIVGGSVILGLLLDQVLGTGRLFIFLFLIGSIPLNLWAIYRYTVYQAKRLQPSTPPTKEDSISED
jgi:F0F1-type ATP synthase assembly protein I